MTTKGARASISTEFFVLYDFFVHLVVSLLPSLRRWPTVGHASVALILLAVGCGAQAPPSPAAKSTASPGREGWFRTRQENGRWWLIDPDGKKFLSKGVNVMLTRDGMVKPTSVGYNVETQPGYEDVAWAKGARTRLEGWGFNTVGSWSADTIYRHGGLPFTVTLHMTGNAEILRVFESDIEPWLKARTEPNVAKWKDSHELIGWFTDNELPWYGNWGWPSGPPSLLERFASLSADSAGKKAAVEFLRGRYCDDFTAFSRAWEAPATSFDGLAKAASIKPKSGEAQADIEEFTGVVAKRYAEVTAKVLKELDPNHMNLGIRYAGNAPDPVIKAVGPFVDVVSLNLYRKNGHVPMRHLRRIHVLSGGKPIMITEFSYRAMENRSGDANTGGADVTVPTQADRGARLRSYLTELLSSPCIVGYHWFLLFDQSPGGRTLDGENSNYGLVDIHDKEYDEVTSVFRELNPKAESLHESSTAYEGMTTATRLYRGDNPAVKDTTAIFDAAARPAKDPEWWGDQGGGAKGEKIASKDKSAWFASRCATGGGWGCGWSFHLADDSKKGRDLSGATSLLVSANIPRGATFQIMLAEAGCAAPETPDFAGERDADGESYSGPKLVGEGKWTTYRIPLDQFEPRDVWGNPSGNDRLDLQAISWLDVYFGGNQGEANFTLGPISAAP